jgi:small-conductance mechanosensitive channel
MSWRCLTFALIGKAPLLRHTAFFSSPACSPCRCLSLPRPAVRKRWYISSAAAPPAASTTAPLPSATAKIIALLAKKPPPKGFLPRLKVQADIAGKFLASLHFRRGDVFITIACFLFPGHITRLLYVVYSFVLQHLDPRSTHVYRPPSYEVSIFYELERAGTLRLGGFLSSCNMLLRLLIAMGKMIGISDPVTAKGGTALRFQAVATSLFFGWTISKIKRKLLMRGDISGSRSPRQRFVLDRVSDAIIFALAVLTCIESSGLPLQSIAAAGGVGGLALGLAGREVAQNLIGGVAVLVTSPFVPGDTVTSSYATGTIMDVGFYITRLQVRCIRAFPLSSKIRALRVQLQIRILPNMFLMRYSVRLLLCSPHRTLTGRLSLCPIASGPMLSSPT